MIVGLGIDVAEISRIQQSIEKFGNRFFNRILTTEEQALLPKAPAEFVAARFAAKEAASKALGTGFSNGITFLDFEILRDDAGKPLLNLHGEAKRQAELRGIRTQHISLTHGRDIASAVVIFEK